MTYAQFTTNIEQFEQSIATFTQTFQSTPEATLRQQPSPAEWSAFQIASHVVEAVRFWVTDLEALLVVPGAKWGRNHEHVRRLAAVEDNYIASLTTDGLIADLQALIPLVKDALVRVEDADLEKTAPSYNANFDGKPLSFLIDHLIIKHVAGHVGQLERHIDKVKQLTNA